AEKLLADAQKLAPRDPAVLQALADLDQAKKTSTADTARLKKLKEDFDLAMGAGRDAAQKKNYPGAVNALKEAVRLMPDDKDAKDLLGMAERLRDQDVVAGQ